MEVDLKRIADAPGYGTGKVVRDQLAAEADCRAALPHPDKIAAIQARSNDGGHLVPMAHFGYSVEGDLDWGLYHDGTDDLSAAFGHDAKQDALTVAAIINAYRTGILVLAIKETTP